jgi:large subunit ribosomal protein L15
MALKLNEIRDNPGAKKVRKTVGRGIGSGLGKTSGRGGKGQTARSGVSLNGFEGGQMPIYRRLPHRGFKNSRALALFELHFQKLAPLIKRGALIAGQTVDANFLLQQKIMPKKAKGISLIQKGALPFAVNFVVTRVSANARVYIERLGGQVSVE